MIRINPIELSVHHGAGAVENRVLAILRITEQDLLSYEIVRRSTDARKKEDIRYSYMIDVSVRNEDRVLKRCRDRRVSAVVPHPYVLPLSGRTELKSRPVIIGTGPAGLFAGLLLAEAGYRPVLLERGEDAETRAATVRSFWDGGKPDPDSNVCFGEGGAGTFSDGKLNTLVKDDCGRNREVLKTFVRFGADPEILFLQKPHVGTDRLIRIVTAMRREIEAKGGTVLFRCRAERLLTENGSICGVRCADGREVPCSVLVYAGGHSSRDTFRAFFSQGIRMEEKAFAVGLRVQHPQKMIDISQFGEKEADFLSPASYKLTAEASAGRGVYTFCMCPGGYVINASGEDGCTAVNGMSYHGRNSASANSAVIVAVTPADFGAAGPLAGIDFQYRLERAAYRAGGGKIPVQLFGDFREGRVSTGWGAVEPCFRGQTSFADLHTVLPAALAEAFTEGMLSFGRRIAGFDRPDAILAGIESRTSSPVRIPRDASFQANVRGFYPCGEGAGYAGGITSAAMDGMKVAEEIIRTYDRPSD